MGVREAEPVQWRGLRAKFRCWLTENTPPLRYEDQLADVVGGGGGGEFKNHIEIKNVLFPQNVFA